MDELVSIGERIAYWRKKRGYTQQVLAGLVGRTASWLSKVERGERIFDRLSVLFALANALKVQPGELIGGVALPPNGGTLTDPPRGIAAVRRALVTPSASTRQPPTLTTLRRDIEEAKRLRQDAGYETLGRMMPELLTAALAATEQDEADAWWCLAVACEVASSLAITVGEFDLAWIAADRGMTAARRSGDDLLLAVTARGLAHSLHWLGMPDAAASVCSDAADRIAPTDATPPQGWSVWGSLQLTEAINAIRLPDATSAWRLLGHARAAAARVGPGRNDYWTAFGPANADVYAVAVALEDGNPVEALRVADSVALDELPTAERRARFLVEVARAHLIRRDDAAAVGALLEAERHSAEEVRYQVVAREIVRACMRRERRSRTPGLRGLAARLGVTD